MIPRKFVKNNLSNFSKELNIVNGIVQPFNELYTGGRQDVIIHSVSSSELSVILEVLPPVGQHIAISIASLIWAYKTVLDIRIKREDLKGKISKNSEKSLEEDAAKTIENDIDKQMKENFEPEIKKIEKTDKGRANELRTEFPIALRRIANRIDNGFGFVIRMISPAAAAETEDVEEGPKKLTPEQKKAAEIANEIQRLAKDLQYLNLSGEPILSLPEPDINKSEEALERQATKPSEGTTRTRKPATSAPTRRKKPATKRKITISRRGTETN